MKNLSPANADTAGGRAAVLEDSREPSRRREREDWNRRYADEAFIWTVDANRFLMQEASGLLRGSALDLAAGEGRNAVWLAEQGWQVLAVDFSDVALDKGRRLATSRRDRTRLLLQPRCKAIVEGFDNVLRLRQEVEDGPIPDPARYLDLSHYDKALKRLAK